MSQAMDAAWLEGKRVAFTGRLATMTRAEAATLVREFGGQFVTSVSRHTSVLVVGLEGLPLTKKGRLTHKLQRARKLHSDGSPRIVSEEEFFDRLGLATPSGGVHRRYTSAQLCRLLRIPRDRLRSWLREGLIKPVETVHGVCFFDFQQVTSVKTLWDLSRAGVTAGQIRKSLEQLQAWLGGVNQPLEQLALIERDGRLLLRLDEGQLAEPSGQLQFDFAGDSPAAVVESTPGSRSADHWWELGCDQEEAGNLQEAEAAYRQALLAGGPNPQLCFNLGNVLYALGQKAQAAERFRQAVELERTLVEAWNNLGNVLAELDQCAEALSAYQQALKLNSHYADAHYNLADTLEQVGRPEEARPHWQSYLRLEPAGPWSSYARRRLAQQPPRSG